MINLYEFQQEDVNKLQNVRSRLIGNEMGTGKTPEAVVLDRGSLGTLVVGPSQTLQHWKKWFEEDGRDIVIIDPSDSRQPKVKREEALKTYRGMRGGVLGIHWQAVRLLPELERLRFDHIITDECQEMQNRKSQQTRALKKIKANYKTATSGTACTGAPNKFWSCLNWLYPNDYRSYWDFYANYVKFETVYPRGYHKITGPRNEEHLRSRIDSFYVRHLKKEQCCEHHPEGVMPWLPDKYYTPYYVDLAPKQRSAYNDMKKHMLAWVGEHEQTPLAAQIALAQMMRLQQFAVAYAGIGEGNQVYLQDPSTKLDAVMEILENNPEQPIVVFTQFNKLVHLLTQRLQSKGIEYVTYTGENRNTRDEDKQRFVNGEARVFIGNIAAGGVGLDGLQHVSNTVVFTDRLWSAHLNKQAEDRLWRDGQRNAVQVIDIIARDTVDRGRHQHIETTWEWIKRLLDG